MYDITIVGSGVSGIFLAYTLLQSETNLKILMVEKGKEFLDRICPIEIELSGKCMNCKTCNKIQGFGGMGRSEGKFNYTNDFGGNLGDKIGNKLTMDLMENVDKTLCLFGGDKVKIYSTENEELIKLSKGSKYDILNTKVRHLGTKLSYEILEKMYIYLKDKVDIKCETDIITIDKKNNVFRLNIHQNVFRSKVVVLATGISGGDRFLNYCKNFNIVPFRERLDLGIRVEMKGDQLEDILKDSFEVKVRYRGDKFEATTYCMNPKGKVIKKYQEGLVMADGQNQLETDSPSCNLNFSIFVPRYFSCHKKAREYARSIIQSINRGKERIVIQRFGDILKNRETTNCQLFRNSIMPSLAYEGGNLYNEIPKVYIEALLKIFESIESLTGKKISMDTLLYGIDAKFYEPEISTNEFFETKQKGLYITGDCSGVTYSLSQAAASAVYLGRHLLGNEQ
ncbi:NAD(P)/FAD-dependent oxidoreductase [Clostridium lacusfryxellense]|uniref:NAD(P)/FAD-dependent oxidoreductase n=1 Tax=Clostridium lacusfryxellense TaxID=205328 RepID=UPI001C0CD093|nr:hypothetical protein [Clostridium lacusfryxellense]MBU3112276.1 hypothetical protein [Clostridium lacusfryxellense]